MLTTTNTLTRAALALALGALSGAAAAQDGAAMAGGSIRYGGSSFLACQRNQAGADGRWVEANGISTAAGPSLSATLRFSQPVVADRLHAAMNGEGARSLALVEIQGADGAWRKAWEGRLQPPAPGFEQTCFESRLPRKQPVQGVRFSFRAAEGAVELDHAALLRR